MEMCGNQLRILNNKLYHYIVDLSGQPSYTKSSMKGLNTFIKSDGIKLCPGPRSPQASSMISITTLLLAKHITIATKNIKVNRLPDCALKQSLQCLRPMPETKIQLNNMHLGNSQFLSSYFLLLSLRNCTTNQQFNEALQSILHTFDFLVNTLSSRY